MNLNKRCLSFCSLVLVTLLISFPGFVSADYTIVLKSGGRLTVKAHREENGMVKFQGRGWEVGLAAEQLQSIQELRDTQTQGLVLADLEKPLGNAGAGEEQALAVADEAADASDIAKENATYRRTEKLYAGDKEKGYQGMYDGLVGSVKTRTDLHWLITRGTSTPDPVLLSTLEAINGRIDDINSRIKDAMHDPSKRRGTVKLLTNSTFSGQYGTVELGPNGVVSPGSVEAQTFNYPTVTTGLPSYSTPEAELSVLRRQLEQLYEERKNLIEAFKQEKLFTGSLPYEAFP